LSDKNRTKGKGTTSNEKGEVVESIVAMMHQQPDVEVRRDVYLPAKNDNSRKRQIDVLLLGQFAGYSTTFAVECKNYKRNINVQDIGGFRDLLDDIGLPPHQGILVSASKIGPNAVTRARELGMKVYELAGLTQDSLSEALHDASQIVAFAVPAMSQLSIVSAAPEATSPHELFTRYDASGEVKGTVHDLLWLRWLEGEPPSVAGEHPLRLEIPEGWYTLVDGRRLQVLSATAKVTVRIVVVKFTGTSSTLALVEPRDQTVQRFHVTASFETFGKYPVLVFDEEAHLETFIEERHAALKVTVGRVRTPRIQINHIYWPPSKRVVRRVLQYRKFYVKGRIAMPTPEDFAGLESTDLKAFWEPIDDGQPALKLLQSRRAN